MKEDDDAVPKASSPTPTPTPATATATATNAAPAPAPAPSTPVKKPPAGNTSGSQQASNNKGTTRRSARVRSHDPIIAPGFGTRKDIENLSRELSRHGQQFPVQAVEEMMKSRGRGIGRRGGGDDDEDDKEQEPAVSSAWADFLKEEGVDDSKSKSDAAATGSSRSATTKKKAADEIAAVAASSGSGKRSYELEFATETAPKKSALSKKLKLTGGELLQCGTLDTTIVGRSKAKLDAEAYHLAVPTRILPGIRITKVFTSCNSTHSIAVDTAGRAYGWGRNESNQLGSQYPSEVVLPTHLDALEGAVQQAALGKGHTVFLMEDGELWAVGANKSGQCGVRTSTDVPNYRKCVMPDPGLEIVQIACGEAFSVALSSDGHIYTTGSSEYGQLGNGETGEYFVTANKLAFSNCNVFTKRNTFCHAPNEKFHLPSDKTKVVPLNDEVRIQAIACGKNHTLALEAQSDQKPRVFSWGCGNYGCLGHGVQADEYFPRSIGALLSVPTAGNVKIAAGAHCSLLVSNNGHVYYWGKHRSVGEAQMKPTLVDVLANNQHVVRHCDAGGQTVVCCTQGAQTVAWGQGPHGELGLGTGQKSSAKPTFIDALDGCLVSDLACGYGHTLFLAQNDDKQDAAAIKKLPEIEESDVEALLERSG